MGTRGYIVFGTKPEDPNADMEYCAAVYRQFDSYPSGCGKELRDMALKGKSNIINGFSTGQEIPKFFNGIECFAAYAIGKLKESKIGNIYMTPIPDDYTGQDWTYVVYANEMKPVSGTRPIMVRVYNYGKLLYDGTIAKMPVTNEKMLGLPPKSKTPKKTKTAKAA